MKYYKFNTNLTAKDFFIISKGVSFRENIFWGFIFIPYIYLGLKESESLFYRLIFRGMVIYLVTYILVKLCRYVLLTIKYSYMSGKFSGEFSDNIIILNSSTKQIKLNIRGVKYFCYKKYLIIYNTEIKLILKLQQDDERKKFINVLSDIGIKEDKYDIRNLL